MAATCLHVVSNRTVHLEIKEAENSLLLLLSSIVVVVISRTVRLLLQK
jgi:hypothetical protein